MSFDTLGLDPRILKALADKGYTTPSPIQEQAIPIVLQGKDLMAAAQTGTGKTAGFTLPIIQNLLKGPRAQNNSVRALVLTPTRELAQQVADNVAQYSEHLPLKSTVVYGGVKINPQMQRLRGGADVLVATPGRLLDLYKQNAMNFRQLEVLVLDEADRMLDMGFIHDLKRIMAILPPKRQTLLFSATFSAPIKELAKQFITNPSEVSVSPANSTAVTVTQKIYPLDKQHKPAVLVHLIKAGNWQQVLVFSKTKHGANKLAKMLDEKGIKAAAIHGNKSQGARTRALADFKSNEIRVLVATDIAARGIDIDQLPHVVNFDLPKISEDYVHRIGRTGRAGASGEAVSLVCHEEFPELQGIERVIGHLLQREFIAGFNPSTPLPESSLTGRIAKPKKPKQPQSGHKDGQRGIEQKQGQKSAQARRAGQGQRSTSGPKSEQGERANPSPSRRRRPAKPASQQ
jgi:ATP-dependent RNA helicase RhlE